MGPAGPADQVRHLGQVHQGNQEDRGRRAAQFLAIPVTGKSLSVTVVFIYLFFLKGGGGGGGLEEGGGIG